MPGKLPWMKWCPADWRKDAAVQRCSMSTRGIWRELIDLMWDANPHGILDATKVEFCRMVGCTEMEFDRFIDENERYEFANVTQCNGVVTVLSRRLVREEKKRKQGKKRQQDFRDRNRNAADNGENDAKSSEVRVKRSELREEPPTPLKGARAKKAKKKKGYTQDFEQAWSAYPKRLNNPKDAASKAFEKLVKGGVDPYDLTMAARHYAKYCEHQQTEQNYIKMASTFFGTAGHWKEWVEERALPQAPNSKRPAGAIDSDRDKDYLDFGD